MKIGIIGLPQTGKTTVFNALTGAHGDTTRFHADAHPALGMVKAPDERLDFLVNLFQPKKVRHATIEMEDIAGIFTHLKHGGEDSARAFALARDTDGLIIVLRCFADPTVPHILGGVEPARDCARMEEEMLLADLAVIEHRVENIRKDMQRAPAARRDELQRELDLLERCRVAVEEERGIRSVEMTPSEEKLLRSYAFLTLKPRVYVLNVGEDQTGGGAERWGLAHLVPGPVTMCARLEMELLELDESERAPFLEGAGLKEPASSAVIRECFRALNVRTFFTFANDEVGAWIVQAGDNAVAAAGKIHSDMAEGFIRAEVVSLADLKACGTLKEARAHGKVRLEGRDYEVQEGDVITFRFGR
jgi:GTP-binding protein YchF